MSRPASRTSQRPASRSSFRAPSPTQETPSDAVGLRNQIAATKHEIRQASARLQQLELALQRAPRLSGSIGPGSSPLTGSSHSPDSPEFPVLRRRSSLNDANGDSLIPGPSTRISTSLANDIKEGVPTDPPSDLSSSRRARSPHDSISRIPVASVGYARALAEDTVTSPSQDLDTSYLHPPPSPGASTNRKSAGGVSGGTTRVLADLQAAANSARASLESTKAQLRQSQRAVAQLTRQTEDLKDGRERLRLEIDGLNQVVSRKERLLQEVLERARKAEAEANTLKTQLKTDTITSKKSLRDMEEALSAATTKSQKAHSEYTAIQSSYTRLGDSWRRELDGVRQEMAQREALLRKEADEISSKYKALVQLVQERETARTELDVVKKDRDAIDQEWADGFRQELTALRQELERNSKQAKEDTRMTGVVHDELARILRLMHALRAVDDEDQDPDAPIDLNEI